MIKQFVAGSCYSYIASLGREAVIIDPHISLVDKYSAYIGKNSLALKGIIDTHTHADHFSSAAVLKKKYGAPVFMHERAVSEIADRRLKDSDEIAFGDTALKTIYTPGHTDDSMSLVLGAAIFTGDVLLIGSVGRTDFQNGSPESMFDTLKRLGALPENTVVYPAHDYNDVRSSTIGKEKASNPFMKQADKNAFVNDMRSKVLKKPFNMDNIIRVNRSGEATALEMISPNAAYELLAGDGRYKLLDVRGFGEYAEMSIKGSLNIPMDMISQKLDELSRSGDAFIVLCRTGNRSAMAADMLMQSGIKDVKVLDGGIMRWQKEGLAVERSKAPMSLERQVRAIAGSLILLGVALAAFVHPVFIALTVFVGCGLVFAGLTDNCMMGMLLMKLPYNRKQYKTKSGGGTCAMG